ncbi:MAG: PHP domain-containing protein [Clostridiaceae bacterium]|mgnify:CR=1 FL=1|jgi:predicted metal-dependent phosphoesterase TrpH|nr:PHP domain-containing protein [Clostridiaceae bacterium]
MITEDNGKYIDLHTHSMASDGSMTPAELVRHAFQSGLAAMALTDHDTVAGVEEALEEGARTGVEVIAGVEISVSLSEWGFNPDEIEMHLLGYFFTDGYRSLQPVLEDLRRRREQRNPKIIEKLNGMGIDITMEEVAAKAPGGVVGRGHIARVLMEKGYTASVEEGFAKYLGTGKPAYVSKDKLTPEQGIAVILEAGGVPVLAHPVLLGLERGQLPAVLERLKKAGLKGIEALYSENTPEQTRELLEVAEKTGLKVTGGSDFHGIFKPEIKIGTGRGNLKIPYRLLEELKDMQVMKKKYR